MDHRRNSTGRVGLIVTALALVGPSVSAQEIQPVGNTKADQQRNAELLKGYDYSKYPSAITGYTGQDRQQIVFERRQPAIRTRVGPRGNYKAGLAELPNGKLVLATCRNNNDADPTKKRFLIHVYESADLGLTWKEINKTPLFGKEPSLSAMANGTLVMSAQRGYFGPGSKSKESINMARSTDGGRTWVELTKGLPSPFEAAIEAICLHHWPGGMMFAMGSSVGEVYISEDDGASWSRIAERIPPVSKNDHHFHWFPKRAVDVEIAARVAVAESMGITVRMP